MTDSERPVWVVRAGKNGEDETDALEKGLVIIGWHDLGNLGDLQEFEDVREMVASNAPEDSPPQVGATARQLFAFTRKIGIGDMVVLPLKQPWGQIAIGTVTGEYQWHTVNGIKRHTRTVDWKSKRVQREVLPPGLRRSISSPPTVYRVRWEGAAGQFHALLSGQGVPEIEISESSFDPPPAQDPRDEILDFIRDRFVAHDMERLVAEVISAEGYTARQSAKGPDGGIDIVAGRGPFGFDSPRIVVQVKATDSSTGISTLRELRDAMRELDADHGLLVSWSGFTKDVEQERRREYFRIRLWDANNLLDAVLRTYHHLPESIRAELPLRQVWTLQTDDLDD